MTPDEKPLSSHVRNLLAEADTVIGPEPCDNARECDAHGPMTRAVAVIRSALAHLANSADVAAARAERYEEEVNALSLKMAILETKVSLYAALAAGVGAIVGGVVGSLVVYLLTLGAR